MDNLRRSNGQNIIIEDDIIDNKYSVDIIGKNITDYTESVARSLLQKLENYASNLSPDENLFVGDNITPLTGQLWYDTSINSLKIYDERNAFGEKWELVSDTKSTLDLIPPADATGDIGSLQSKWHFGYATHLNINTDRVDNLNNIPALTLDGNILITNSNTAENVAKITPKNANVNLGNPSNPLSRLYNKRISFSEKRSELGINGQTGEILTLKDNVYSPDINLGSGSERFNNWRSREITTSSMFDVSNQLTDAIIISKDSTLIFESNTTLGTASNRINLFVDTLYTESLEGNENTFSTQSKKFLFDKGYNLFNENTAKPKNGDKIVVQEANGVVKKASYLDIMPNGIISPWNDSSDIPNGWFICDGRVVTNIVNGNTFSTPNMKGSFIRSTQTANRRLNRANTNRTSMVSSSTGKLRFAGRHTHGNGEETTGGKVQPHILTEAQILHTHQYNTGRDVELRDDKDEGSEKKRRMVSGRVQTFSEFVGGESIESEGPIERTRTLPHEHDISDSVVVGEHTHTFSQSKHDHETDFLKIPRYEYVMIIKLGDNWSLT